MAYFPTKDSVQDSVWGPLYPEVEHLWRIMHSWDSTVEAQWENGYAFHLRASTGELSTHTAAHIIEEWAKAEGFHPSGKSVVSGTWVEHTRGEWTIQVVRKTWSLHVRIIHSTL